MSAHLLLLRLPASKTHSFISPIRINHSNLFGPRRSSSIMKRSDKKCHRTIYVLLHPRNTHTHPIEHSPHDFNNEFHRNQVNELSERANTHAISNGLLIRLCFVEYYANERHTETSKAKQTNLSPNGEYTMLYGMYGYNKWINWLHSTHSPVLALRVASLSLLLILWLSGYMCNCENV